MYVNRIFLDIETLPPQGGNHLARIRDGIKPPGQYKKPESIAQWLAENGDAMAQEEFQKLGLDGLYGEICVIGWAVNNDPIHTVHATSQHLEREVIVEAFESIQKSSIDNSGSYRSFSPVGHNIDFDMRFLMQRAVRYGIPVPPCLRNAFDPEKGRFNVFDTMRVWAGYKGYTKLKDMSRELLDDNAADIDGSQVAATWTTDPQKVVDHCRLDVERVRKLYQAFALTLWGIAA
jgi:DNA polymerase elongation subunit (family B)